MFLRDRPSIAYGGTCDVCKSAQQRSTFRRWMNRSTSASIHETPPSHDARVEDGSLSNFDQYGAR
jgi:hypothetical protein